jgi:hypothetical protein
MHKVCLMNPFVMVIGLLLIVNLGSIFWQIIRDRPFRVIYIPVSPKAAALLGGIGMSILLLLLFDRLVTHYFQTGLTGLVILLGYALLNGLSVYYRWRVPLRASSTSV